jgi:NADH-quinone oxidoreductase subunit J
MTWEQKVIGLATVLLAAGLWIALPRGNGRGRWLGWLVAAGGLGLLASLAQPLGHWGSAGVFWILAGVTIIAALGTITFRSPVYCALWFALSLLGTAGLFLIQGAQFLGVATIVVYAGAILVTFLFVLMLAQPEGHAYYDRLSWEAMLSSAAGAVMIGVLTMTVVSLPTLPEVSTVQLEQDVLATEHVAKLGGQLFSRHLVSVELAGTLLLVALVGAIAIVSHDRAERAPR